ncbi:MAG: hypothetical protein WC299_07990 [Kiritimatiellia bacterium]
MTFCKGMIPPRKEINYEFRRRLEQIHLPGRRDPALNPEAGEVEIGRSWRIIIPYTASQLLVNAARDLQDFLLASMDTSVLLVRARNFKSAACAASQAIVLATAKDLPEAGRGLGKPRSYRILCTAQAVTICGFDDRGAAQGGFYLEDMMNFREAPFIKTGEVTREPVFSPRMVHSGWGLDQFPDAHLNAMAHHGFDAILVFARGVDASSVGYLDFNSLVDRAAAYGLDVYFYSYLKSTKHPDEPDAAQYYDSTYGALFKACPRARGIVMVGESVEFPSKDERTTGRPWNAPAENGLPPTKPSPGWWPCRDYPQWIEMVRDSVRKYNPAADIVFWTYNWGGTPEKDRLALIKSLPDDITLLVTFEMYEKIRWQSICHTCVDYTISFAGPGRYFTSEAKEARRRKIRLYTMCNTGGLTWDFGVVPYEPVPMQWARRHRALLKANREWGLSGLMESHHFGWWPSFVSELAKWAYWTPSTPADRILQLIAARDYGREASPLVMEAWKFWSRAICRYVSTDEDQYGPFRVGPSYPFVFHPKNLHKHLLGRNFSIPSVPHAKFGSRIVVSDYTPLDNDRQSPFSMRIKPELRTLGTMLALWQKGIDRLEKSKPLVPARKLPALENLLNLGLFMRNCIRTTLNIKEWWILNRRLTNASGRKSILKLLDEIEALARREIANAESTIPLVERDSRLGWEPSMEYMTDAEHLRWKIAQVKSVIAREIPAYRRTTML